MKNEDYNLRSVAAQPFKREAHFIPQSVNREERTIDVTWTTGARVLNSSWDDELYYEELSTNPQHIRKYRLENGAPLLDSHWAERLEDQIGSVVKIWFENGAGHATVKFRSNKKSLDIFNDVAEGVIRNLSIGYLVYELMERERKDGDEYRTLLATDYEVFELSFVPINADAKAQVRSHKENKTNPMKIRSTQMTVKSETTKEENEETKTTKETSIDLEAIKKEAVEKEKRRSQTIFDLCKRGSLPKAFAKTLVDGDVSLEASREKIFNAMLERDAGEVNTQKPHIAAGDMDEVSTRNMALSNAILHRQDSSVKLEECAYQYRGMSLLDVAQECLEKRGIRVPSRQKMEIVKRAFGASSDFPQILSNVANKSLMTSFEHMVSRQTFTPLVKVVSAPNFKEMTKVRLGEHPSFKEIPKGAEITAGTMSDSAESYRIATYGRKIGITRQDIINDDLGAFNSLGNFGAAGARLESLLVWSIFLDNLAMGDGNPLFSERHGNLSSGNTAQGLDVEGLSEAEYRMSIQTGQEKEDFLNIEPKFLIVPSRMKTEALKLINQRYLPNKQADFNPFEGGLSVISEPRLNVLMKDNKKPWFLAADSNDGIDMIELAYLDGIRAPQMETMTDFDTGSIQMKAWLDVGSKAIDWRGLHKSEGKQKN